MKDAAENYFKNVYREDYLTFRYVYKNRGSKIHKFRFSDDVDNLFLAAQDDYLSVVKPRLFMDNNKEIVRDKKIKCIGALNIANNSNISVWWSDEFYFIKYLFIYSYLNKLKLKF